jgi:RNA polymerase sigma-70 factor, ECF subfamily
MSPEELVRACLRSRDPEVWREFMDRFHRLITTTVLRTARHWGEVSPDIADELVQETYLKLCADQCRLLRGFQTRHPGSIFGYLKVVTANVVHDYFKSAHCGKRGAGQPSEALDPECATNPRQLGNVADIERAVLLQQIDCLLARGGPSQERDRAIFWLYYGQGLSARAIAAVPSIGLSTKGVESALLRLTRQLRVQLNKPSKKRILPLPEKGFRSAESF